MKLKFIICSLLVMTSNAMASDVASLTEKLKNCATLVEDRERLACFDNLTQAFKPKVKKVEAVAQQRTARTTDDKKIDTAVTLAPKSTEAKQPVQEQARKDSFGEEHLAKTKQQREEEQQTVIFTVKTVEKNAHKQLIITFENGQQWRQTDNERLTLRPGTQVELQVGAFSVIYLKKTDASRKIKVRRVK
ncbi:hypothetical protein [Thalassotalea fusca]